MKRVKIKDVIHKCVTSTIQVTQSRNINKDKDNLDKSVSSVSKDVRK